MPQANTKSVVSYVLIAVTLTAFLYLCVHWIVSQNLHSNEVSAPADVSLSQLLAVPEVLNTAKIAEKTHDSALLSDLQLRLIDTAEQLQLSEANLDFLKSQQLIEYLQYHARRAMFNDAVQVAYMRLEGIDDIKALYPEASDLFVAADQLIAGREQLVYQIALTLANNQGLSVPTQQQLNDARDIWQAKMQTSR